MPEAIAEQIGMMALARIESDLTHAADAGDAVAIGAIPGRLIRIGECSLTTIWDQQGLSEREGNYMRKCASGGQSLANAERGVGMCGFAGKIDTEFFITNVFYV